MTIQEKTRTTKQGLRDLNFYGSRKKPAADAVAEGALTSAESIAPVITDGAPAMAAPPAVIDPMASSA
jgi:hypothetical protein